jgi:hypothetical protein
MPNTLAHMGAQALVTRGLIARADLGWIWLGCLLPDLPWILQRVVRALPLPVPPIDLRLYATVQSSLLFSLAAAAGFALLARRPARVFVILALGCLLHLLLDATETKWANGVLLFAPLDWHLLNFGFYWPEDWPIRALSILGLGYFAWALVRVGPSALDLHRPPVRRGLAALALFAAYALGPLPLMPAAEAADLHFAGTLRDVAARAGREVEFDRARIRHGEDGLARLSVWTGETLDLAGLPVPASAGTVSVRGRFLGPGLVEVAELHLHRGPRRDMLTVLGLLLMLAWWASGVTRSRGATAG